MKYSTPAFLILLFAQIVHTPVSAMEYQIHGFASQAYLLSEGNNYYGDSTNGSHDFYEAAINGSLSLGHGLLVSAQALIRDAGISDNGKPRLDYALVDWRALDSKEGSAGVRLGRVKNPMGLFNDTRDVVFTRPSILLPQSVYFDGTGVRSLLFSSDGAQVYGDINLGNHRWSLSLTSALNRDLTKKEKLSLGSHAADTEIRHLNFSHLTDHWNNGQAIIGLSHGHAHLVQALPAQFGGEVNFEFNFYVVSAQYNAERVSLTTEYMYTRGVGDIGNGRKLKIALDGGYTQLDFRPAQHWTTFLRYDVRFNDAGDRDGRKAAATSGSERYSEFAHDLTLGLGWTPDENWGVWGEVHRIYGTATAPPLDNPDGANDSHWTLMTVMVGYRF